MRRALYATAVAAILLLAGCPFASDYPLSDPADAPFDEALLGTWENADPEGRDAFTLTIARFNDHELLGVGREERPEGIDVTTFRLFVTEIGTARFLNIMELTNEGEPRWYFARYAVSGDTLRLRIVDDALFESTVPADAGALRAFFRAHFEDDALYGGTETGAPSTVLKRRERAAAAPALSPTF